MAPRIRQRFSTVLQRGINEREMDERGKKKSRRIVMWFFSSAISRSPVQYGATTDDEKKIAFDVMTVLCERFECISTYTLAWVIIPYFFFFFFIICSIGDISFGIFNSLFSTRIIHVHFFSTTSVKYVLDICIFSFEREILINFFFIIRVILLLFFIISNCVYEACLVILFDTNIIYIYIFFVLLLFLYLLLFCYLFSSHHVTKLFIYIIV